MPALSLRLLGMLDICYGDQPLPERPRLRSQSLLARLIVHRHHPQLPDRLVGLFRGDPPECRARHSLSTARWHIRRCLPDEIHIPSDPYTVQFDPQGDLWLDVDEFESQASHDDIASLQSTVVLYARRLGGTAHTLRGVDTVALHGSRKRNATRAMRRSS